MRRLSAVVFTGLICMSAVSAGADTTTALVELRGIGKSAGNSRAVISSTNLKLLRT